MILLEIDSFCKRHELDDHERTCLTDTRLYDVYVRALIYKKQKRKKKESEVNAKIDRLTRCSRFRACDSKLRFVFSNRRKIIVN